MRLAGCLARLSNRTGRRVLNVVSKRSTGFGGYQFRPLSTFEADFSHPWQGFVNSNLAPFKEISSPYVNYQRRGFLSCGDGDEDSGLSKHYEETRLIGYSPEQLFTVVATVDLYEDFVPWCQRSTVISRPNDEELQAELEIGFKFFVERYVSHVKLKRPHLIKTTVSESNIFEYLDNAWEFKPGPVPTSCKLHFCVDFQFRSPLYRKVANMFFDEVVSRLVGSFENRCATVYGSSAVPSKVLEGLYPSHAS